MLKETINEKWKAAFKERNNELKTVYDFLKQRILVVEKSGKFELPLTDAQITDIIVKEYKERKELLTVYKPEDSEYKAALLSVNELEQYLPKQLSEEEVIDIIKRLHETETNTGKLTGMVIKEIGNSFDRSKIAGLVKRVCC